jgi:hypothetical protein
MRRELLWVWVSALAAAVTACIFSIAGCICEADPSGLAIASMNDGISRAKMASFLRHGSDLYLCAGLLLLTMGLIEDAARRASDRKDGIRS